MRRISAICLLLATAGVVAGDRDEFIDESRPVQLAVRDVGSGWREWQGFDLERNERITALYVTPTDADPVVRGVWVGTSHGWLYRGHDARWTIEAWAQNVEVTGIAIETDDSDGPVHTMLLSTSDGIRTVGPFGRQHDTTRTVTATRSYFAHVPCVSPFVYTDPRYQRPMGFVDDILVRSAPYLEPLAISSEHGVLFKLQHTWMIDCCRSYRASERLTWVDPDAPIPHRRPTCVVEDRAGHTWLGTDGDGIVRINRETRFLNASNEDPYFVRFSPDDIGCRFTRVTDAERGLDDSLWFTLTDYGRRSYVARFCRDAWTVIEIPPELGNTRKRNDDVRLVPPVPFSIAEVAPGRLLIGAENAGNLQLEWETRSFERVSDFENRLREIEVADDGAVWATTATQVYECPVRRE